MSIVSASLSIRGIDIDVLYKDIKNLHIGVYPPFGRVRVAAPNKLDDDQVRLAVIQRLPWIKRQREQLMAANRQSEREFITGESHYIWGTRKRLKIVKRPGSIHFEVDADRLILYTNDDVSADSYREELDKWYRSQLREAIPVLIDKWSQKLDTTVPKWTVRKMKTKWGSCNRETRNLWFNVELAKKHPDCLEYIIVHEMTHYFERNHNERFSKLMDLQLPNWKSLRSLLNTAPLAAEKW